MGYSQQQIQTLEIINYSCASFSVIGSLFIIISYLIFSKLQQKFSYSLIFYLAIADLIRSIGKIWGSFLSDHYKFNSQCSIAGLITNFGGISSFFFVAVIAIVMYTCVNIQFGQYWNVSTDILRKRKYMFAIVIWTIALIVSLLPFSQNAYGYVGAWCWIAADYHHWRWLCFYGPLIFIFIFCIVMYIVITRHLQKIEKSIPQQNRGQYKMFMNLKYYPLVLLIAFLFPTIRRVYQMFDDEAPFWLGICHTLGAGLYGGLNAIVYGINRSLKKEYKQSLEGTIRSRNMKVVQKIDVDATGGKYTTQSNENESTNTTEIVKLEN